MLSWIEFGHRQERWRLQVDGIWFLLGEGAIGVRSKDSMPAVARMSTPARSFRGVEREVTKAYANAVGARRSARGLPAVDCAHLRSSNVRWTECGRRVRPPRNLSAAALQ